MEGLRLIEEAGQPLTIEQRRRNCLAYMLNTAVEREDLSIVEAEEILIEVMLSGGLDEELAKEYITDDPWLGMRTPHHGVIS